MQEMDIFDMNVLDDTENDTGIHGEDDDGDMEHLLEEEDAVINEEPDTEAYESKDEARDPEVRSLTTQHSPV